MNNNLVEAYQKLSDERAVARQALGFLYLVVKEVVVEDIREKVENAFSAYESYIKAITSE